MLVPAQSGGDKVFKRKAISIGNITLSPFYDITSYLPSTPVGYEIYEIRIKQFNGNVPMFTTYYDGTNAFLWGTNGQSVSAVYIWVYYIKKDLIETMT